MIEPTLNGCPTDSSSSPSRPCVRRRQVRLSRFTSVAPSWRGPAAAPASGFPLLVICLPILRLAGPPRPQHAVASPRGDPVCCPALGRQPALQRIGAQVALHHQVGGAAGG